MKPKDTITRAKKCLEKHQERESDNISRAEEAIRFRALEQWPRAIKLDRENPNQDGGPRPCPVLDKTNQFVRQIVNEERQNRAAIRIRPVDDKADKKVAEILSGIVRHIEDRSQAIEAYTTAGEHAIDGGFGYWRLLTEYSDPLSFDQEIVIKRIPNRFSVALGYHNEPDGSDAEEALIWEDMSRADFKSKYPKAKEVSFDDTWGSEETVRVAEYMCIKRNPVTIHLLEGGQVVVQGEKDRKPKGSIKSRTSVQKSLKWHKLTSAEVLEEKDMIGTWIPVVKVIGNELVMPDGKIRLSGAVEGAMDPQRLHNYAHAGFIENVALAPRAPWLAEEQTIEGYENDYARANRQNLTVLKYKSVDDGTGQPLPPPQRIPPAGLSTGWQHMLQNTEHGVEGSFGMYGANIGAKSQEKSGIALQEQKTQGMIGTFHFPDNLARSIQHTGRILVEWIPKVYDTERVARILGEDGETDMVRLNPDQESPVEPLLDEFEQEVGSIYNLHIGQYDVTVSTGPSYTSKRQESVENQLQLINARPDLLNFFGDIILKNMDWPGSDEIAERMKAMLPPQIQEMEANKDKKPIDPRVKAMMTEIEQASAMLEQRGQELAQAEQALQSEATKVNADKTQIEALKKELESKQRQFMAEAKATEAQLELKAQQMMTDLEGREIKVEENNRLAEMIENLGSMGNGLGQGMGSVLEQNSQMLAQLMQSMNIMSEGINQNAQALQALIEIQTRPKTAVMSDGRKITVN